MCTQQTNAYLWLFFLLLFFFNHAIGCRSKLQLVHTLAALSLLEKAVDIQVSLRSVRLFIKPNPGAPFLRIAIFVLLTAVQSTVSRFNKMEDISKLISFPKCRLCGVNGIHKMDILDIDGTSEPDSTNELAEKIFRCVGIQVGHLTLFGTKNNEN